MVKTTLELRDDLYKKLVNKAIEKYGNTKSLSRVVNESLESHMNERKSERKSKEEVKRREEILKTTFGSWGPGESGKDYVRKIRDESEKRRKRLGI